MKKSVKILMLSFSVILCIVAIVTVWFSVRGENGMPVSDNTPSVSGMISDGQSEDNDLYTNDRSAKEYTVAFLDSSGNLLKEEQVQEYRSATHPSSFIPDADKLFIGWDKDFSYVFSNIIVRPNYLDISSDKNFVYANAVYTKPGEEVSITVKIGGQVNLAALQMYIDYDENLLEYVEAKNLDAGVMINKEDNSPRLRLAFLANENITGSVDFIELVFHVKGHEGSKAVIMYDIEKAATLSNSGEIMPAEYTVKDTVIHIY